MQLRRSTSASEASLAKTMPGQSSSLMFLSRWTSCALLVKPGVAPTPQTLLRLSELISDDLPTLGKPMTPTLMDVLMSRLRQ